MQLQIADLPEASRTRLLAAVKNPPVNTFVIRESRLGWALVGLIAASLSLLSIFVAADGYRWQSDGRAFSLLVVVASFVGAWISVAYLIRWARSEFKAYALINPLYFMRIRFDRIEAIPLAAAKNWDVKHGSNSKGVYTGTTFRFQSEGDDQTLKISSLGIGNDLVTALNSFPAYISDLLQRRDTEALYAIDLLYEWRVRESQFPRRAASGVNRFVLFARRFGPSLLAGTVAVIVFFAAIDPYNNYRDDEQRWRDAQLVSSATSYRLYAALRPDGRHLSEAQGAISKLYEKAANDYINAAGSGPSQGTEAVIQMLEYAKSSGRYKVFVEFVGDNKIPQNIEEQLRSRHGVTQVILVGTSFTSSMNEAREAGILEKISESFGKVIPGDVLEFARGTGTAQDIGFVVNYAIRASGDLYYLTKEEQTPKERRDFYAGVSFDWRFRIGVPGLEASAFQFSFESEPAQLFKVASSTGPDLAPINVYSAMAGSAFDDFGSKLVSQVSFK
jgi:hypothetical protein